MSWWRLIIINNKYEKCFLFLLAWCWGKIRWTPLIVVKKALFSVSFHFAQKRSRKRRKQKTKQHLSLIGRNFEWKCEINCCCRCRCRHRHHHCLCRYRTHHLVKAKSHPLQNTFCSKICFFKVQTSRRASRAGPRLHWISPFAAAAIIFLLLLHC